MRIIHFREIDSTNEYAKRLISKGGISEDMAIVADIQTAGRGRLNQRVWESVCGNFHGTFVINLEKRGISESNTGIITSQVLIKLQEYLVKITDSDQICLKLPNDLLIRNKKVAGVLVEILYPCAVIGIGLNLKKSPLERATNILSEFGIELTWIDVVSSLEKSLLARMNREISNLAQLNVK